MGVPAKGVDWIGGRLSFKAKGMEVEVPNRSLLSEVDDVASGITESAERVVKENADDVVETVMERGSGAVSIPQGKFNAESNDISYESIMRALRQSDTKEGYAVAALLKRGKIELRIEYAHPKGYGGLYKFGTNYITIYESSFNTPLSAAGYTTHETRHFLQNLSPSTYAKIHEFEAFSWQRNVDKSFGLRLDREIWDLINTHPAYKNLKTY